jgi:hypothetical protein
MWEIISKVPMLFPVLSNKKGKYYEFNECHDESRVFIVDNGKWLHGDQTLSLVAFEIITIGYLIYGQFC